METVCAAGVMRQSNDATLNFPTMISYLSPQNLETWALARSKGAEQMKERKNVFVVFIVCSLSRSREFQKLPREGLFPGDFSDSFCMTTLAYPRDLDSLN